MQNTLALVMVNVLVLLLVGVIQRFRDGRIRKVYVILILLGSLSAVAEIPLAYYQARETEQMTELMNSKMDNIESGEDPTLAIVEDKIEAMADDARVNRGFDFINRHFDKLSPGFKRIFRWGIKIALTIFFLWLASLVGKLTRVFANAALKKGGADRVTVTILMILDVLDIGWLAFAIVDLCIG